MSDPPPPPGSSAPPPEGGDPAARARRRVITLSLEQGGDRGSWRKRLGRGEGEGDRCIRLEGSAISFEHPSALQAPLTVPAGIVAIAAVDHARPDAAAQGRFAILHRMSSTAVVPQSEGVEGWLWTADSRSALPMLGDGAPNLALVFVKPLEAELVEAAFRPDFLASLAKHSPLGVPTVNGLLARVADAAAAEAAFNELGVIGPLTDREVAPAQRRHLSSDRRADPSIAPAENRRRETSVPPPGLGRRSGDR